MHLAIVGSGPATGALQSLAAKLGLSHRLHLVGHRDDIDAILPAFDVFCLPSRSEGLPRSIIEAQACGIPVVASDVGGVREAVCPETGTLVPPDHPLILARALTAALETPPTTTPRRFVETRFAWAETVAGYAAITGVRHAA